MKKHDDAGSFKQNTCPFVSNGECEIPPCDSCFIDECRGMLSNDGYADDYYGYGDDYQ